MVYLDLFSGIGGFALAARYAGYNFETHYFSEIDKYATSVYQYHFPDAISLGDVKSIRTKELRKPDIITFGFPCQDLSVAGKGQGLHGSRSGLFYQAIRIIQETQPSIFIFENVKGLLFSRGGEDFKTVLQTIADLGIYDCEWQLLNTSWFLPQNRERIYFIGHLRGRSRPKVFPFTESCKELIRTQRKEQETGQQLWLYDSCAKTFRSRYYKDGSENLVYCPVLTPTRLKKQNGCQIKESGKPAFTIDTFGENGIMYGIYDESWLLNLASVRKFTPIESERLQGFPDNYTKNGFFKGITNVISDTQRYKQIGNAVSVPVAFAILKKLNFCIK